MFTNQKELKKMLRQILQIGKLKLISDLYFINNEKTDPN